MGNVCRTGNKGGGFKMKPWQGMGHAAIIGISVWLCRFTLFEALQWWTGLTPSDGLILGSLILSAGVAFAPIVTQHFSHIQVCSIFTSNATRYSRNIMTFCMWLSSFRVIF